MLWAVAAAEYWPAMSAENVELVGRIFSAWERGDFSSTDWADPAIEFSFPGPTPGTHRGIEEMGKAWGEWLNTWKGFSVAARELIDAGEKVVAVQTFTGEGRGSGLPIEEVEGAAVFSIRDGRVTRFTGHTTVEAALEDAGVER